MNAYAKALERTTRAMDRRIGKRATYTISKFGELDIVTGLQADLSTHCSVVVREWPMTVNDVATLLRVGITQVEKRFAMLARYVSDVAPGDIITLGSVKYEALGQPASSLDEFGVEWTIYTRRMRS